MTRIDSRLERIGFLPRAKSTNVVASVLFEQRLCGARIERYRAGVGANRSSTAKPVFGRGLAAPKRNSAKDGYREPSKKHPARHESAIYRPVSGCNGNILAINGKIQSGTPPESPAVGAPALCGIAAG